jgi:hypothetical protein
MRQIFVFTAGDKEARKHLDDSITNPAPFTLLEKELPSQEANYFKSLMPDQSGFFAWGAVPGARNVPTWKSMQVGDLVLTAFDNRYHYFATVVGKLHSKSIAQRVWGVDGKGNTWEYMYFLSPPQTISGQITEEPFASYLNRAYRGFVKISDARTERIRLDYGSLDAFVEQELKAHVPLSAIQNEVAQLREEVGHYDVFDASSEIDGRKKILRAVVSRQGQPKFRSRLLEAYDYRCAVTDCGIESVLEAAHIKAYDGANSNAVQNGLLLRADIHTLYDLGYLKVDEHGSIHLHEALLGSDYQPLHGRKIRLPKDPKHVPDKVALGMKFGMVL